MTLLELRTLCRKKLGDANAAFWTNDELNTYINDGARDLSFRTKCLKDNGYLSTVSCSQNSTSAGSREWTLTDNFTNIYSVNDVYFLRDGTDWTKMIPSSRDDLNEMRPGWMSTVGYTNTAGTTTYYNYDDQASVPQYYYWSREEDVFGVEPPPDDDNAGSNYIRVYYSKAHADVTDDGASPTIPEPLQQAIVNYVSAVGFEDRGWGDRANDQWNKYFQRIKDYTIETGRERDDDEIIMKNYRSM